MQTQVNICPKKMTAVHLWEALSILQLQTGPKNGESLSGFRMCLGTLLDKNNSWESLTSIILVSLLCFKS